MSFLGAGVEAKRLKQLQSQYQFQSLILNAKKESTTAKMGGIQATCNTVKTKVDKWNNTAEDKRAALWKADSWYKTFGQNTTGKTGAIENPESIKHYDYSTDAEYVQYEAEDEYIDTRIDNLESLLTLLDTQIKNTENLEQNGIKDNSWWCVGGGN